MSSTSITITDWRKQLPGKLNGMSYEFPVITSINAHGKKTIWQVIVELVESDEQDWTKDRLVEIKDEYFDNKPMPEGIIGRIRVSSCVVGGKQRVITPTYVKKGKNIGRANETNVFCQTLRDALGKHNKQLKKAKTESVEGTTTRYPPMLAQLIKDKYVFRAAKHVYVQRKYNGVRAVITLDTLAGPPAQQVAIMYSRKTKLYPVFDYIKVEWLPVLKYYWEEGKELYIDGEIYKHGMPLQDISGYARRETPSDDDPKLNFMVYDLFLANAPKMPFSERLALLNEIFKNFTHFEYSVQAETFIAHNMEEVNALYKRFLEENYEGAMIRLDAPYKYSYNDYHAPVLLKMKPVYDEEYTVVGWDTGEKGKAAKALMIICETPEGQQFPVNPALELPERVALAAKMAEPDPDAPPGPGGQRPTIFDTQWRGKRIRVYFDEKSKDGIPLRARTKLEREGIELVK